MSSLRHVFNPETRTSIGFRETVAASRSSSELAPGTTHCTRRSCRMMARGIGYKTLFTIRHAVAGPELTAQFD
jgi:hypothetical protein